MPLHLSQARTPPWLEVLGLRFTALNFIFTCSGISLHFLHSGLSMALNDNRFFDLFIRDLSRANYKRFLLDALHRCSRNLLVRHIYLLRAVRTSFFMSRFIETSLCLIYLFKSHSKAYCNCSSFLEFLTLFIFHVSISNCLGLYVRGVGGGGWGWGW